MARFSTNRQTAVTAFGANIQNGDSAKAIGVVNLSVAFETLPRKYNGIADLLATFIAVSEGGVGESASRLMRRALSAHST